MLYGAHRPVAASARARRLGRSVGSEARAGRQGRARVARSGAGREQPRDVPGRRSGGGRRRHRGARARCGAADQGRVRGAAARHRSSSRRSLATRRRCSPAATCVRGRHRKPAISRPGSRRPRTPSRQTYATHVITHACMESHGTVCEWDGDKLTAWISTQGINGARENFATALKIPQANVRVICQYMGGGFGSKALSVGAEGLICARLAKEANAPVKLMLDRKEEHLATGNRPSATARIKAGVSADGIITAFDAEIVGHGRRRRCRGFPAAVHLSHRESPPHAQGRVHQHRPAAADARAGPPAGLVPHRDHDGRARRQGESGSGRVPDQEPAARGAERDVGQLSARGRRGVRLGQAASDRRHDARADQDRHGRGHLHVGRRRPRPGAGALRDRVRWQRGHAHRHAGHRHRHADARRHRHRRVAGTAGLAGQSGDRRHALRRQPRLGRQHDGGQHQPGAFASPRSRRSTR